MPRGSIKAGKAKGKLELPDGTKVGKAGDPIFELDIDDSLIPGKKG